MKCNRCGFNYSDNVILMPVMGGIWLDPLCGVCALEIIRAVHGMPDYEFTGEIAKEQYELALKERRQP